MKPDPEHALTQGVTQGMLALILESIEGAFHGNAC
jgi:hypothetical protein